MFVITSSTNLGDIELPTAMSAICHKLREDGIEVVDLTFGGLSFDPHGLRANLKFGPSKLWLVRQRGRTIARYNLDFKPFLFDGLCEGALLALVALFFVPRGFKVFTIIVSPIIWVLATIYGILHQLGRFDSYLKRAIRREKKDRFPIEVFWRS